MKTIILSNGKLVLCDDEDFLHLSAHKWFFTAGSYAGRWGQRKNNGKRTLLLMHSIILGAKQGERVDHIDGDALNNQKKNLRIVTHSQNMRNSKKRCHSLQPYKGVYQNKSGSWSARITVNNQRIRLGTYKTAEDAATAYDTASTVYHRDYGRRNF